MQCFKSGGVIMQIAQLCGKLLIIKHTMAMNKSAADLKLGKSLGGRIASFLRSMKLLALMES